MTSLYERLTDLQQNLDKLHRESMSMFAEEDLAPYVFNNFCLAQNQLDKAAIQIKKWEDKNG